MRRLALVVLFLSFSPAPAAVVSFLNATGSDLTFTVEHKGIPDIKVTLPAGRTTAVRVGREPVLRATLNDKPAAFKLDPYTPYLFVENDKGVVAFSGVELNGELPKPDDVPADPPVWKPLKLPVTLFTDSSNALVKEAREKGVKERFAAAAKVIDEQVGVRFEVTEVKEWEADGKAESLVQALGQFERAAAVKGGRAFGFLSRAVKGDELIAPPTATHALVKDGVPKADAERAEVVTHLLGQWLGAVRSPDGGSVMRAKPGDGKANQRGWAVQFDPLNLIVLHVWADELAAGRGPKPEQFHPNARRRLVVLYKSIAGIHDAMKSDDTQARDMAAALTGLGDAAAPAVAAKPPPPEAVVPGNLSDDEQAIRAVVRAVTRRAEQLAADEKARPKGDELTAEYVKAAAAAAAVLDEKRQARAFLLGLGVALDDSTVLRDKPVVKKVVQAVESDDDRKARLEVLGRPTLRGRRDLCQHFAVSAALTETFGAAIAEAAGLAKERADMLGTSGFSFADLAADLAGIELATAVTADPTKIAGIAKRFVADDYLPDVAPFAEGLTEAAFRKKYGSPSDERFQAAMDDVRKAVKAAPAFRK